MEPEDAKGADSPQAEATLGIEDAMGRLALGRAQVYRLVKDGKLKATKRDALLAFSERDLATAAGILAERRESVADLLRLLAAKLAEQGIDDLPEPCADDITDGVGVAASRILLYGIAARASDLFVMPGEDGDRYLARFEGRLLELARVDRELGNLLKEQLKAMALLPAADAGEHGAIVFKFAHEDWSVQVRMSVLPTMAGEQLHLQPFSANVECSLDAIGLTARQGEVLHEMLADKPGLYVLTGSQHRFVQEQRLALAAYLSSRGRLVVAIDRAAHVRSDDVIHLDGRHAADTDATGPWQTAMGLGPDAIMVDQVEDSNQAAHILAALTAGITVLVHVERATAVAGITALTELGLARDELCRYLRAATEFVVVPRLCTDCREPRTMRAEEVQALGEPETKQVYIAAGCDQCDDGFRGSRAVWGLLLASDLEFADSLDGEANLKRGGDESLSSDTSLAAAMRCAALSGDTTFDHSEPFCR